MLLQGVGLERCRKDVLGGRLEAVEFYGCHRPCNVKKEIDFFACQLRREAANRLRRAYIKTMQPRLQCLKTWTYNEVTGVHLPTLDMISCWQV